MASLSPYTGQALTSSRTVGPGFAAPVLTLPYAKVFVCATVNGNSSLGCSSPVAIFADSGGLIPLTQPVVADAQGNFTFWAAPGLAYAYIVSADGLLALQTPLVISPSFGDSSGIINVKQAPYFAHGDGVTDDTLAIQQATNDARVANVPVYLPPGAYAISDTIDARTLRFFGAGIYTANGGHAASGSALVMQVGVQKSVVLISYQTELERMSILGGWDGITMGGAGYGVEGTSSDPSGTQLSYHKTVRDLFIGRTYGSSYFDRNPAYTLLENIDAHRSGGKAGCEIQSSDDTQGPQPPTGFGATSTTIVHCTFSDTAGSMAPGILINDGVNIRVIACTSENTSGYLVQGPQCRALSFLGCYQENTSGGKFLTMAGSAGIGFNVHGCSGVMSGPTDADYSGWQQIDDSGNWFAGPSWGNSGNSVTVRAQSQFFDPLRVQPNEYIINPGGQTALTPPIYTPSASWSATLRGTFVDFTGGNSMAAPLMLVTSNAPSVNLGHVTLTFSMAANGALQATVSASNSGATTCRFLGWIEVLSDRNNAGAAFAIQTMAAVQFGPVYSPSLNASNGYNGPVPAGKVPVFTNGICTGVQ